MSQPVKPREFWIDEGLNGLDLGWYKTYVSEFPRKHETSGTKIIHVIEYSAYEQLKAENEKLKGLILLIDPAVSEVEVNSLSIRQWSEFIKHFPQ